MTDILAKGTRYTADLSQTGAATSRGANLGKRDVAAAWSGTWPAPGAALDLDFVNNKGYVRGVGQGGVMDAIAFTRASSGTYIGPDGKLAGSGSNRGALGNNLLVFPQDFDNAAWVKQNCTVAGNSALAPNGTWTASTLFVAAGGVTVRFYNGVNSSAGQVNTSSIYFKPGVGVTHLVFNADQSSGTAIFDVFAGTASSTGSVTASIANVGGGWYRAIATYTAVALDATDMQFWWPSNRPFTGASPAFAGNEYIVVWGAQTELGSTATTYYPTNINAPRFDWANTIPGPQNLLLNSRYMTSSPWQAGNSTIALTTDDGPFGIQEVYAITPTATLGTHSYNNVRSGGLANFIVHSCYLKANGYSRVALNESAQTGASSRILDLSTGQLVGNDPANATTTVENLGSGWYRLSWALRAILSGSPQGWRIIVLPNGGSGENPNSYQWTPDGVSGVLAYGMQVEYGTTSTNYIATGAQTPITTTLAAAPTCNGLLIEESRTNRILWCRDASQTPNRNLLAYSEQFNNAYWTKVSVNVTADATTAPDGTTTADRYVATAISSGIVKSSAVANGTYTLSCYFKANTSSVVGLLISSGGNGTFGRFDLSAGTFTVTSNGTGGTTSSRSGTLTSVGNGWYRATITCTTSGTNDVIIGGDGVLTDDIYVWGAQLEISSSASTYEQTTTSGAIWSKQGITTAKDQEGIDGVANAATSITTTTANGTLVQPIVLTSGVRTGSVYLKRITGTGIVQVTLDGSTWSTVDLSATEWRRIALSGTVTNPVVGIRITTNGDAVAMDYAQVEDGSFATTPILTASATVTRSADLGQIPCQVFVNNSAGTYMHQAKILGFGSANGSVLESSRTGAVMPVSSDNIVPLATSSSTNTFRQRVMVNNAEVAGYAGAYGFLGYYPYDQTAVLAYSRAGAIGMINGYNSASSTTFIPVNCTTTPVNQQTLYIGSALTRHIKRITYHPFAVSQDIVKAMSLTT